MAQCRPHTLARWAGRDHLEAGEAEALAEVALEMVSGQPSAVHNLYIWKRHLEASAEGLVLQRIAAESVEAKLGDDMHLTAMNYCSRVSSRTSEGARSFAGEVLCPWIQPC